MGGGKEESEGFNTQMRPLTREMNVSESITRKLVIGRVGGKVGEGKWRGERGGGDY